VLPDSDKLGPEDPARYTPELDAEAAGAEDCDSWAS
jgi:hypothetical protein